MKFWKIIMLAFAAGLLTMTAQAGVMTSVGAGSAVESVLRQATFTGIKGSLANYAEGGLSITTDGKMCCFKDIFYTGGSRFTYTTITTPDSINFTGLEFDLGTGGVDQVLNVVWRTMRDGTVTGSGLFEAFATTGMARGANVVGWRDVAGFDTLHVGAGPKGSYTELGQAQAIALDNVKIGQIAAPVQPMPVPEPASLALLGLGIGLLALVRRTTR